MKRKGIFLSTLTAVCVLCLSLSAILYTPFVKPAVAETTPNVYMQTTRTLLPYNGSERSQSSSPSSERASYVGYNGLQMAASSKTNGATAVGLHAPANMPKAVTWNYGASIYRVWSGTSKLYYRLVRFSEGSNIGEVIYPTPSTTAPANSTVTEDLWLDVSKSVSGSAEVRVDMNITINPGDSIYQVVYDPTYKWNGATIYSTFGGNLNNVWFDASKLNHINSTNDTLTTNTDGVNLGNYFGIDSYTRAEMLTYEEISFTEVSSANVNFDNYESWYLERDKITLGLSSSGSSRVWPAYNINLSGTSHFALDVTNPSDKPFYVSIEPYEASGGSNYGQCWVLENGMEYYVEYANGFMSKGYTSLIPSSGNIGGMTVPANFTGTLYAPVTGFTNVAWQFNRDDQVKFGEIEVFDLSQIAFFDVKVYGINDEYDSSSTMTLHPHIIGQNLYYKSNTYKTTIQAINDIGTVSVASENAIINARTLYNALSDTNKAQVTNYAVLTAAEETFASLTNYSYMVNSAGKNFTGSEGVILSDKTLVSPSTLSAWIKVDKSVADSTHIGTIIGNGMMDVSSTVMVAGSNTVSMEVTAGGHPVFTWRVSNSVKHKFVVENVDVRVGKWLNVAFTRDSATDTVYCYINGSMVASSTGNAGSLADIDPLRPLVVGNDYYNDDSMSHFHTPDFNGQIAEVRVYTDLLSDTEIVANMSNSVSSKGLVADVQFASGEESSYYDRATKGEVFDNPEWVSVSANDLATQGDYSIAVLGDTQMMFSKAFKDASGNSLYNADGTFNTNYDVTSNVFYNNVSWLIENKDLLNLQFVMHQGDLTDNFNSSPGNTTAYNTGKTELTLGLQWMQRFNQAGIPWSLNRGNHDGGSNSSLIAEWDSLHTYTSNGSFAAGYMEGMGIRNSYYTLNVDGVKYLILSLDLLPSDAALTWACGVVEQYYDHRVIVTTHTYTSTSGSYNGGMTGFSGNTGEQVWNKFASLYKNIVMVVCGHSSGTNISTSTAVGVNGNKVLQLMVDASKPEFFGYNHPGMFGLLSFANGGNTINFNFYSVVNGGLYRPMLNSFTLELDDSMYDAVSTTENMQTVDMPTITAMRQNLDGNNVIYDRNSTATTRTKIAYNGLTIETGYYTAINMNILNDGVFFFDKESTFITRSVDVKLQVFLKKSNGTSYKVFPKNSDYYTVFANGTTSGGYFWLDDIGGIEVNNGDVLTVGVSAANGAIFVTGIFNGKVYSDPLKTTTLQTLALMAGYSTSYSFNYSSLTLPTAATSDLKNIANGTKTDYSFGTYGGSTMHRLTIVDADGTDIQKMLVKANSSVVLPQISRGGLIHIGYNIGGSLYPVGYSYKVTAKESITAVFVDFTMYNGASMRMTNPVGLRWKTFLSADSYNYLTSTLNLNPTFGTLVVKTDDITSNGVVDYSLINVDTTLTHLNIANTVGLTGSEDGNYKTYCAALVGIKEHHYDWNYSGLGYMSIEYANGSSKVFYAGVTDTARSISDVASTLISDISVLKTDEYANVTAGGYTKLKTEQIELLNSFIVG
ncbi:MAG: hypothetical protein E7369_03030 [Clostridiales bacterium]|nr:hypothetical protein [Clostridiales bacterium]